jgi:hypothetical protein
MANYWDNYWRERNSRRRFWVAQWLPELGQAPWPSSAAETMTTTIPSRLRPQPRAQMPLLPRAIRSPAPSGRCSQIDTTGDPPTLDPYGNISFLTKANAACHYSRLFQYKAGPASPMALSPDARCCSLSRSFSRRVEVDRQAPQ